MNLNDPKRIKKDMQEAPGDFIKGGIVDSTAKEGNDTERFDNY